MLSIELGVVLGGLRTGHQAGLSSLGSSISPLVHIGYKVACPESLKWGLPSPHPSGLRISLSLSL